MAIAHKCPKCRTEALEQRGDADLWTCTNCGGAWAGRTAVPRMAEVSVGLPATANADNDAKSGMCPEGHGILSRARVEARSPFSLERCSTCFGVWFDRGEWQRVAEESLAADLPHFWEREWRAMRRREQSREAHLDAARADFGEELYGTLTALAESLRGHPRRSEALAFLKEESSGRR
jgi:Zn-finger nucleic acid-binding protein